MVRDKFAAARAGRTTANGFVSKDEAFTALVSSPSHLVQQFFILNALRIVFVQAAKEVLFYARRPNREKM